MDTRIARRFWPKVRVGAPDECWEWTAAKSRASGYGYIRMGGRGSGTTTAHRIAYQLTHGPVSPELVICHRCDNRSCVNPAHLFAGTSEDNMRDMVSKQRQSRGERHTISKMTEARVRELRRLYGTGQWTRNALALRFGIHRDTVRQITSRRTWKHVA